MNEEVICQMGCCAGCNTAKVFVHIERNVMTQVRRSRAVREGASRAMVKVQLFNTERWTQLVTKCLKFM